MSKRCILCVALACLSISACSRNGKEVVNSQTYVISVSLTNDFMYYSIEDMRHHEIELDVWEKNNAFYKATFRFLKPSAPIIVDSNSSVYIKSGDVIHLVNIGSNIVRVYANKGGIIKIGDGVDWLDVNECTLGDRVNINLNIGPGRNLISYTLDTK